MLQKLGTELERWKYRKDGLFWDVNGNWKQPVLPRKIIFRLISWPIFAFNRRFHEYLESDGTCAICLSRGWRMFETYHPKEYTEQHLKNLQHHA